MKIIGGHDYYEGAGLGVDESIVFLYKERLFEATPLTLPDGIGSIYDRHAPCLRFFRLLIGGEVIPGVREKTPGSSRRSATGKLERIHPGNRFHFDAEAALDALARIEAAGVRTRYYFDRVQPKERISRFFRQTERADWTGWMIENHIVVGHNHRSGTDREAKTNVVQADIATLKELEAFRALDPATAHMRISNWIGGVLPQSIDTVELSDISRIKKAGFDTVSSFRAPKGAKKSRRRKV
ncbi:MAG: hypothetical protein Q4P24_10535 [Rhodobacterales bacterium]|nr:hypothetical protein [Rhodobacterales bacterium]